MGAVAFGAADTDGGDAHGEGDVAIGGAGAEGNIVAEVSLNGPGGPVHEALVGIRVNISAAGAVADAIAPKTMAASKGSFAGFARWMMINTASTKRVVNTAWNTPMVIALLP